MTPTPRNTALSFSNAQGWPGFRPPGVGGGDGVLWLDQIPQYGAQLTGQKCDNSQTACTMAAES